MNNKSRLGNSLILGGISLGLTSELIFMPAWPACVVMTAIGFIVGWWKPIL